MISTIEIRLETDKMFMKKRSRLSIVTKKFGMKLQLIKLP